MASEGMNDPHLVRGGWGHGSMPESLPGGNGTAEAAVQAVESQNQGSEPPPPAGSPQQVSQTRAAGEPTGDVVSAVGQGTAASEYTPISEALRGLGVQFQDGLDDQAILSQLAQGYQRAAQAEQLA